MDHGSLVLGTHVFRHYSFNSVVQAIKHSGLDQTWVELLHFLYQLYSIYQFIYCEVEQELWVEERDEHPKQLEEKATPGALTFGGYVKVYSAPYAYDQSAEANRDDPESAPMLWFIHPRFLGIARSDSIGRKILHLF